MSETGGDDPPRNSNGVKPQAGEQSLKTLVKGTLHTTAIADSDAGRIATLGKFLNFF